MTRINKVTNLLKKAFQVFSQHPKWVYYARKPIENAVYYFYEKPFKDGYQKERNLLQFCNHIHQKIWENQTQHLKGWMNSSQDQKITDTSRHCKVIENFNSLKDRRKIKRKKRLLIGSRIKSIFNEIQGIVARILYCEGDQLLILLHMWLGVLIQWPWNKGLSFCLFCNLF